MRRDKNNKHYSTKQEQELAEAFGGRRQPASGALWWARDDVRKIGLVRAEAKWTDSGKYRLKLGDYLALRRRALARGETPAFVIEFRAEKLSITFTDYCPEFGGIREIERPEKTSFLVKSSDVLDLERRAYKKDTFYSLEVIFPTATIVGLPTKTFLEVLCRTS